MFWVISALAVLTMVLLSLGNIYKRESHLNGPDEWKRVKHPVWGWILTVLISLTPILNLFGLITLGGFLIEEIVGDDDYQIRGPIGKFIAWLTKEV